MPTIVAPIASCRTCGKHVDARELIERRFCCDTCALDYERCINCGGYFERDTGYQARICSRACHEHPEVRISRLLERVLESTQVLV